jgi:transposase
MKIFAFDIAKDSLMIVQSDKSATIKQKFVINNTSENIDHFLDQIGDTNILVAAESTGDYHRELAISCLKRRIPFRLLNPITTKQFTRATVRKKKTDLTDALIIAKLALQGEGTKVTEETFSTLKPAIRTAMKLSNIHRTLKVITKRFETFFPQEMNLITALKDCDVAVSQSRIIFQERSLEQVDPTMKKLLISLPGIGDTLATLIASEIGSVKRFHSSKSLVAYAGLDPKVRQSGIALHHNTNLTKRGSPYLRGALFLAAAVARMHDPELKTYYQRKRSEGRVFREAVVAVARKLTYRIYAVLKRGTPYVKNAS